MPLGTKVGLVPGHIVLHGDRASAIRDTCCCVSCVMCVERGSSLPQSLVASTHAPGSRQAASANQRPPGHGSLYKKTDALRNGQNGSRDACCVLSSERELRTLRAIQLVASSRSLKMICNGFSQN